MINLPTYSLIPGGAMRAPAATNIEEYLYLDGLIIKNALSLSVEVDGTGDARTDEFEFHLAGPVATAAEAAAFAVADYGEAGRTGGRAIDVRDIATGFYRARARSSNATRRSFWVLSAVFESLGKLAPPSTPGNFTAEARPGVGVHLSIDAITDADRDDYSYYFAQHTGTPGNYGPVPAFPAEVALLARAKSTTYLWDGFTAGRFSFWVVAHDTSGIDSIPAVLTLDISVSEAEGGAATVVLDRAYDEASWEVVRRGDTWSVDGAVSYPPAPPEIEHSAAWRRSGQEIATYRIAGAINPFLRANVAVEPSSATHAGEPVTAVYIPAEAPVGGSEFSQGRQVEAQWTHDDSGATAVRLWTVEYEDVQPRHRGVWAPEQHYIIGDLVTRDWHPVINIFGGQYRSVPISAHFRSLANQRSTLENAPGFLNATYYGAPAGNATWAVATGDEALDTRPVFSVSAPDLVLQVGVAMTPVVFPGADRGNAPIVYSIVFAPLPAGLEFSGQTLSGTPTELQDQTLYVYQAQDADDDLAFLTFHIRTTNDEDEVTGHLPRWAAQFPAGLANLMLGIEAEYFLPSATGIETPLSYGVTGLPTGMLFNHESLRVSGAPTDTGIFLPVFRVTDSSGDFVERQHQITVAADIAAPHDVTLTYNQLGAGFSGHFYNFHWNWEQGTQGAIDGFRVETTTGNVDQGGLPLGTTDYETPATDRTAVIWGIPSATQFSVTIRAFHGMGEDRVYSPVVSRTATSPGTANLVPTWTAQIALPAMVLGTAVDYMLPAADGGDMPITYSATGLPAGLQLSSTGHLTGTPTAAGTAMAVFTATDASGVPAPDEVSRSADIIVDPNDGVLRWHVPASLALTVGVPFTYQFPAATGGTAPLTYSHGSLPAGMSFDANTLVLSGTPTQAETLTPLMYVVDSVPAAASDRVAFTVSPAEETTPGGGALEWVGPLGIPNLYYGQAILPGTELAEATGGDPPLSYSATGLPPGLLFGGVDTRFRGTPAASGTYNTTFRVDDDPNGASPAHVTLQASLVVLAQAPPGGAAPVFTPDSLNIVMAVNQPYTSILPAATGGTAPVVYTSGIDIPGLMIDNSTRELSGTPTVNGLTNATLTATDANGSFDTLLIAITVGEASALAPGVPVNIFLVPWVGGGGFFMDWDAPISGGDPASYQWQILNQSQTVLAESSTTATEMNRGSIPSGTYTVRIRAVNSSGQSAWVSRTYVSSASSHLGAPTEVSLYNNVPAAFTAHRMTLEWSWSQGGGVAADGFLLSSTHGTVDADGPPQSSAADALVAVRVAEIWGIAADAVVTVEIRTYSGAGDSRVFSPAVSRTVTQEVLGVGSVTDLSTDSTLIPAPACPPEAILCASDGETTNVDWSYVGTATGFLVRIDTLTGTGVPFELPITQLSYTWTIQPAFLSGLRTSGRFYITPYMGDGDDRVLGDEVNIYY